MREGLSHTELDPGDESEELPDWLKDLEKDKEVDPDVEKFLKNPTTGTEEEEIDREGLADAARATNELMPSPEEDD